MSQIKMCWEPCWSDVESSKSSRHHARLPTKLHPQRNNVACLLTSKIEWQRPLWIVPQDRDEKSFCFCFCYQCFGEKETTQEWNGKGTNLKKVEEISACKKLYEWELKGFVVGDGKKKLNNKKTRQGWDKS